MKTFITYYDGGEPFRVDVDQAKGRIDVTISENTKQGEPVKVLYVLNDVLAVYGSEDLDSARHGAAVIIQVSKLMWYYVCERI